MKKYTCLNGDVLRILILTEKEYYALMQVVQDAVALGCCLDSNVEIIKKLHKTEFQEG